MKRSTLLLALLPILAFAQTPAPETASRPDIDQLLTVMRFQQTTETAMGRMRSYMDKMTDQMGLPAASADARKRIEDKTMSMVQSEMGWDKMKSEYARAFAETFSPEEVKGLIAFYSSPAGQAYLDKQPLLMEKTMAISQQKMMGLMPKIRAMAIQEATGAQASPAAQ